MNRIYIFIVNLIFLVSSISFAQSQLFPDDTAFQSCYISTLNDVNNTINNCGTRSRCFYNTFLRSYRDGDQYISNLTFFVYYQTLDPGGAANDIVRLNYDRSCLHSELINSSTNASTSSNSSPPIKPTVNRCSLATGSIIDFDSGSVSEYIPIAGTEFNLFNNSEYNSNLEKNRKFEIDYSFTAKKEFDKRIRLETSAGVEIENIVYPALFDFVNYSHLANDNNAVEEDNSFIKRYRYILSLETKYPSNSLEDPFYWEPRLSNVVKDVVLYKPEVWGLAGWNISIHHYLDIASKSLFTGFGQKISYQSVKTVNLPPYGTVYAVVDRNSGNQYFVFDSLGRHLETRDTIWNLPIYKFTYALDNKLLKITDRFNKFTEFVYNAQGKLNFIKAPFGQSTQVVHLDNNIQKIITQLGHQYEMTYGNNTELVSFKSINGVTTQFNYALDGRLISELKNNGLFQSFLKDIAGVVVNLHHKLNGYYQSYQQKALPTVQSYSLGGSGLLSAIETFYNSENKLVSVSKHYSNILTSVTQEQEVQTLTKMNFDPFWTQDYVNDLKIERTISNLGAGFKEKSSFQRVRNYLNFDDFSKNGGGYDFIIVGPNSTYINYDFNSKIQTISDTEQPAVSISHNENGLPIEINIAGLSTQKLSYDTFGRITKTEKGTEFESYTYDQYGYLSEIINSLGQKTKLTRNIEGQVLQKKLPNGDLLNFEYTESGELKKLITSSGESHIFQYSLGDYLVNSINSDNKNTSYSYDQDKRLIRMTKPSGQYIQYNYKVNSEFIDTVATNIGIRKYNSIDPLGRVLDIVSEDNIQTVQTWSSDQLKSTKWIDSDGAIIGQLDFNFRTDLLRLNSVSLNGEKFLDYGAAGDNIKGGTINDHISCFSNSTLYSKCQTIDNLFSSEYSTSSDETTMTTKSTVKVNMSFNEPDAGSRYLTLNRFNDSFGQATTKAEDDTYYSTGEQFNSVVEFGPTYDANGRLAQSKRTKKINGNSVEILSSLSESSYTYPANSNNNIKEYINDQKRTVASHKNDDSLIKLAGSINRDYEFDIDGNLKSYTNCFGKTEFEYDIFSNLKKVTLADGKKIEYKVDGFNRRIKKIVNGQTKEYYLWYDQLNLAAVLDENKIPKVKYIYAPDSRVASLIEKNGILYKIIHEPGLDSVRYVINTVNSEIVQEIEYDEQGNMLSNTNVNFQPLGYAGGLYDNDTKLTRFGARDYDPTIGRWTTKDPIGLAGGDTNLYAYVGGNPMSYVDPSGLLLEEAIAKRFTPKQQAAIGAAASTAGAFLMYGSFNPFAPVTFSVGAYLGYEGGANLIKANNRKFIDDVMNDVIPKNSIDDLINPGAKVNLCLMK